MEIKINIIEVASELAHNAAKDEMISEVSKGDGIINDEEEMWVIDENEDKTYTEDAQDVFNRWYDYFYDIIKQYEIL